MANRFKKAAESRMNSTAAPNPEVNNTENSREAFKTQQASIESKGKTKKPGKDEERKGVSFKVPIEMYEAMRRHYAETGEKMTAYFIRLVEEDMNRKF